MLNYNAFLKLLLNIISPLGPEARDSFGLVSVRSASIPDILKRLNQGNRTEIINKPDKIGTKILMIADVIFSVCRYKNHTKTNCTKKMKVRKKLENLLLLTNAFSFCMISLILFEFNSASRYLASCFKHLLKKFNEFL